MMSNYWIGLAVVMFAIGCGTTSEPMAMNPDSGEVEEPDNMPDTSGTTTDTLVEGEDYFLPHIDLNNWKVTLPIGNPTEVKPPEILDYATMPLLQEFMYNDSIDGSLVFYTYPGSTTTNSSYSRTELREQMVPGSNNTNWTFSQGGNMRGTLKLDTISTESNGDYHRTMVMQIHGRLTNAQRDEIGEDDNNAPPILKVYWNKGRVRVLRKILKDENVAYPDILHKDAWTDEGIWFDERVENEKFTIEIDVTGTAMKVILNDSEEVVFDDIHTERWGIFENYFKAGNYLQTTDAGSFAKVKYYDLVVTH